MKQHLIHRYYELRSGMQWSALVRPSEFETWNNELQLMRIDTILFERYGYDLTLTRRLN